MKNQLQRLDEGFGVGMQETEVSHQPKSARQHVLKQEPKEFGTRQAAHMAFAVIVPVGKTHNSILVRENVLFRQDATIKIAAKVG